MPLLIPNWTVDRQQEKFLMPIHSVSYQEVVCGQVRKWERLQNVKRETIRYFYERLWVDYIAGRCQRNDIAKDPATKQQTVYLISLTKFLASYLS